MTTSNKNSLAAIRVGLCNLQFRLRESREDSQLCKTAEMELLRLSIEVLRLRQEVCEAMATTQEERQRYARGRGWHSIYPRYCHCGNDLDDMGGANGLCFTCAKDKYE